MTNDTRIMLNIGAPILGAVLALIAAAMLSGCSTIRDAVDEYRDWRGADVEHDACVVGHARLPTHAMNTTCKV